MSNSNPSNKILPLRKALKNIKNNLQLKRYSSKIVSIINTARKRCIIFSRSISRLIYTKFRTLTNRAGRLNSKNRHHSYKNFSFIYIDELFQGKTLSAKTFETKENMVPSSSTSTITKSPQAIKTTLDVPNLRKHHVNVESSIDHENGLFEGKGKVKSDEISNNPAAADKWKIPLLPHEFRGIDERAEEFIANFRQDMKLQREQSILDFEEMLKRSV